MDPLRIPFGKYKGKSIELLLRDRAYIDWILCQEWVEQKHPDLFAFLLRFNKEQNGLDLKENFLLSLDLKHHKIESFEKYPFSLNVVRKLERTLFHPNVTFIVGENGSGKSTLLEALAVSQRFNPEGGSINFHFNTHETHSELHEFLRIAKNGKNPSTGFFLRAESFYNVATEIDALGVGSSYGGKSLHKQSHGEAFFSLMKHRFGSYGLYILDEPEAALSPHRQMSMLTLMHQLVIKGSQFVICTHSPILLAYPHAKIYEIGKNGLEEKSYEQTQTFQDSRHFLDHYDTILATLLSEEE